MRWLLATILTLLGSHVTMAQHIVSDSIYIPPTMLPKATVFLPATAQTRGIVIQDNRKTLRK